MKSLSHLILAVQLRVAGIVFPAIGEGAFLIARAARQRGVENDGRDAGQEGSVHDLPRS